MTSELAETVAILFMVGFLTWLVLRWLYRDLKP